MVLTLGVGCYLHIVSTGFLRTFKLDVGIAVPRFNVYLSALMGLAGQEVNIMKKFISLLFMVFVAFASYGQDLTAEKHMEFMGITIDGKLDDFVNKLISKGFKVSSVEETTAMLTGNFAGEDAKLFVCSTPKTKTVYQIGVNYDNPYTVTWDLLESQYSKMKNMLKKKYGEPILEKEEFMDDFVEDSRMKLYALKRGRCEYISTFTDEAKVGLIFLGIMPGNSLLEPSVIIAYTDKINEELNESERISDI